MRLRFSTKYVLYKSTVIDIINIKVAVCREYDRTWLMYKIHVVSVSMSQFRDAPMSQSRLDKK